MYYFGQTFSGTFNGFSALAFIFIVSLCLFLIVLILLLPFIFISARIRKKAEFYKNQRVNTIIAQYKPPYDLTPAEIGFLYDMKCDNKEIIATLFNLEQRGIITLQSKNSVQINDKTAYDTLPEYEKIAIRSTVDAANLGEKRPQLPITIITQSNQEKIVNIPLPYKKSLSNFTNAVRQSLKNKNISTHSFAAALCIRAFIVALVIALLPLLTAGMPDGTEGSNSAWSSGAIIFSMFLTLFFVVFLFPAYIAIGFATVYLWSKIAGKYWLSSKQTRALWPEIEGYKQYIKTVDLDNMQFGANDASATNLVDTLPYAIVFGLQTKWQTLLAKRSQNN